MNEKLLVLFDKLFNNPAVREIEYNKKWSNGIGGHDNAVFGNLAPKVGYGSIVKSKTISGRRLLIIGTRVGNFLIYEANCENMKVTNIKYCTTTAVVETGLLADGVSGTLLDVDIDVVFGRYDDAHENIGIRIDKLYAACKRASA